jgi:predicted RND superfamily exporter protein
VGWTLSGLAEQEREFLADAGTGLTLCLTGIYLTLAWAFGSWLRPLAIMAIIPFGIVGTVWGHYIWSMPMSIFTVVGLIGMCGIIVNDSIVLIATVDEYAEQRAFYPAIVDAVCDRLRPILLTSLTTVMGLAPLLYESSQQAQFLKPTVITLVYGLGFGMVLVLLVVPALLAAQLDLARHLAAARHALTLRRRALAVAVPAMVYLAGAAGLFWLTLGRALMDGTGGRGAAFAMFLGGAAGLALAVWTVSALAIGIGRARR